MGRRNTAHEVGEVKVAAARRWVAAVNADGSRGRWPYAIVKRIADIGAALTNTLKGRR
jgi:hypothetical protein